MVELSTMVDFPTINRRRKGWHKADIIAAVHKRGGSLRRLSVSAGFAQSTLRAALQKPHPRANAAIAEFIDKPLHELWPQWFDASGKRLPRSSKSKPAPTGADSRVSVRASRHPSA